MKEIIVSILNMIDEGKITPEEGVKLINAVKTAYNPNYETAKKMKKRVKKAMHDAEPKIRKAADTIREKSAIAYDGISKGVKTAADGISEKINAARENKKAKDIIDDEDYAYDDVTVDIDDDLIGDEE